MSPNKTLLQTCTLFSLYLIQAGETDHRKQEFPGKLAMETCLPFIRFITMKLSFYLCMETTPFLNGTICKLITF